MKPKYTVNHLNNDRSLYLYFTSKCVHWEVFQILERFREAAEEPSAAALPPHISLFRTCSPFYGVNIFLKFVAKRCFYYCIRRFSSNRNMQRRSIFDSSPKTSVFRKCEMLFKVQAVASQHHSDARMCKLIKRQNGKFFPFVQKI